MTLSYVGQLLDELSILWALAVAYSFWYPRVYFPRFIKTRYDSQGHRVAGSEGRAGTLTLVRVTHRSQPTASSPARGQRGGYCCLLWEQTLHHSAVAALTEEESETLPWGRAVLGSCPLELLVFAKLWRKLCMENFKIN